MLTYSNGQQANVGKVVGADGQDGTDGQDGEDGLSVANASINGNGELLLTYTDGNSVNLGQVVGEDGLNGTDAVSYTHLDVYKRQITSCRIAYFVIAVSGSAFLISSNALSIVRIRSILFYLP